MSFLTNPFFSWIWIWTTRCCFTNLPSVHSSGNADSTDSTPLVIISLPHFLSWVLTMSKEAQRRFWNLQQKLKKNVSLICQIRAAISQAALSWDEWHFLQEAMEYISLGYVKMCESGENKGSKTFKTHSKGGNNSRFRQRPEKKCLLESP